jgi:CheY-like chemotaxis protein
MSNLLSGCRILVVEDEVLILMMIQDALEDLGCKSVTAAATVNQAVTLIDGQTFDAAMLDMNLNGNASYVVADALTAHDVPYVFATGNCANKMREGYRDQAVLRKPFSNEDLAKTFAHLLAGNKNLAINNVVGL